MKATGVVRRLDNLGRIVIPIELRRSFNINIGDPLEIFTDGRDIVIRKYEPGCVFCGNIKGVTKFKGKNICGECLKKMQAL